MPSYSVSGVEGLPEVRPGADVAALIAAAATLQDGDVVVVTSKLLSKAEGRLVPVPPGADREAVRLQAVDDETVREVARRGTTVIAENRNGLVVDAALTRATGTAEREATLMMLDRRGRVGRVTLGADKAYDVAEFVGDLRARKVTPHIAINGAISTTGKRRKTAIDGRATRHAGWDERLAADEHRQSEVKVRLDTLERRLADLQAGEVID